MTVNQYAVKVIQGSITTESKTKPIGPGVYYTSVNIHNTTPIDVKETIYHVKLALSGSNGVAGKISNWQKFVLKYDEVTEFDSTGFNALLTASLIALPTFIEGFFVIECETELDVVGVYTGAAAQDLHLGAMHLERVPKRLVSPGKY
jgi:hypothetical protein